MTFLLFLILFSIVAFYIGRSGGVSRREVDEKLATQNRDWFAYIKSFKKIAKDKSQNRLIDDMLVDIQKQGLVDNLQDVSIEPAYAAEQSSYEDWAQPDTAPNLADPEYAQPANVTQPKADIQLDNASLLLYLGAFIFVASMGLFVTFGQFGGYLKTAIVLLLALSLYGAGLWLYANAKKFTQVGIAFAAIGMAIVPLVGLAAYLYVFEESNGAGVWVATSVLCLAVYTHALITFKQPFLNYVFIFTLLSLFESSVSVIDAPLYYYGWALAALGIVLSFIATVKNIWPDFQDSALASAQLFIPLSIVVSLALLQNEGALQMGVTMALAAAFYGLQAFRSNDEQQEAYSAVAHVFGIGAILWLTFGLSDSITTTAITMLALNGLQLIWVLLRANTSLMRNFATVLFAFSGLGVLLAIQEPILLLASFVASLVIGIAVWVKQGRVEGYILGTASLMIIPVVYGQLVSEPTVSALTQSMLLLAAVAVQWLAYLLFARSRAIESAQQAYQAMFIASAVIVILSSFLASAYNCMTISIVVAALAASLVYFEKDKNWAVIAGVFIATPVLRAFFEADALLVCVVVALLANIVLALVYRHEINRWIGSLLWFIMPVAMGNGALGEPWTSQLYAYAYMFIAVGFILARAIARGAILVSSKVPMASFARTASLSYVVGYCAAIITSLWLAEQSNDSQILTTLLLLVTMAFTVLLARSIERERDIYSILLVLVQLTVLSAVRPDVSAPNSITLFVAASSALAILCYWLFNANRFGKNTQTTALATSFIAPASVIFFDSIWAMPVALMVASALLLYHYLRGSQSSKEMIGGLFTVGLLWLMWVLGVRELQAYTHVLVALFALYAMFRYQIGQKEQADQYVIAVLVTATVPLTLQALTGAAGGLYGWWLLLEQIAFIVIGMFIGNKTMLWWGLFVAVAAILYQLRGLGWAALAFLGIFVIGLAAYQIQRINKN